MGKRVRCALIVLVALFAWAAFEWWSTSRLVPPAGVVTIDQFLQWQSNTRRVLVLAGDGEHLCALGPTAGILPSGPSAYVFDGAGRLVDWTADSGDDPSFRNKGRFDRPVRELTPDAALRRPPAPGAGGPVAAPPATVPAAVKPALRAIEMRSRVYLAGIDLPVRVRPDGSIRSERTIGKGLPQEERVETHEGTLTPHQAEELAGRFAGWEDLDAHYGGGADGPEISIRYGDKTVEGGSALPRQVLDIERTLVEIADALPARREP